MTAPRARGDRLTRAVRHFFATHRPSAGPTCVAFSGGADSLALLHAATKIRPSLGVVALHVDHRHRPGTGAAAKAAQAAAKKIGVVCAVLRPSRPAKRTDENTLRDLRRRLLLTHREGHGGVIALAHTADDLVETILLRMIRGAGPGALLAMRAVDESCFVRPLIGVTRTDVEAYLAHHRLTKLVVEDPTNAEPTYLRNRIRHDVLPLLRRENRRIGEALIELARQAARDEEFIASQVEAAWKTHVRAAGRNIEIAATSLHEAVLSRLIRKALRQVMGGVARAEGGPGGEWSETAGTSPRQDPERVSSERVAAVLALIQRDATGRLHDGVVQLGNGRAAKRSGGRLVIYPSPMRRR